MAKILLVEDDKSLREIYGVRLLAEGYDIVSAGDGEEALTVAIHEKPDLIISDVMMPKISGFEMLDLLRNNEATKSIKVVMMTALSGDQHRERGKDLGADRYLVKSQVGLEDVVSTVHELLDTNQAPTTAPTLPTAPNQSPINPPEATSPSATAGVPAPTLPATPPSVPVVTTPNIPAVPAPAPTPPPPPPPPTPMPTPTIIPISDTPTAPPSTVSAPDLSPVAPPPANPVPPADPAPSIVIESVTDDTLESESEPKPAPDNVPSFQPLDGTSDEKDGEEPYTPSVDLTQSGTHIAARVIQPTGEAVTPKVDVENLIANEEAKEIMSQPVSSSSAPPPEPPPPEPEAPAIPEIQIDPTGVISIDNLPDTPADQTAVFPNQSS